MRVNRSSSRNRIRSAMLAAMATVSIGAWVAQAVAADQIFQGPTEAAKAPKDVKLAIVSCSASLKGCQIPSDTAAEVAKGLGWQVAMFDGKANPKTQESAMLDALAWGANVIIAEFDRLPQHPAAAERGEEAERRGGRGGAGRRHAQPAPEARAGPGRLDLRGRRRQSRSGARHWGLDREGLGGKANVVVFNDLEFEGVTRQHTGVMEALAKCGGCVATEQQFAASQIATNLGQQVVGFLRAHPDVTYVYAPYDPSAFAMVAAIRQAGMGNRIKLASLLGDEENLDLIRRGDVQVADIAFDLQYSGYAVIDQIIRYLNKQPLFEPHGENVPYEVLDKTNLPEKGNWASSNGYKEKFQALWK